MMRKTLETAIPGFKLNEEMADKKKKNLSLFHYQNTKERKTEPEK